MKDVNSSCQSNPRRPLYSLVMRNKEFDFLKNVRQTYTGTCAINLKIEVFPVHRRKGMDVK